MHTCIWTCRTGWALCTMYHCTRAHTAQQNLAVIHTYILSPCLSLIDTLTHTHPLPLSHTHKLTCPFNYNWQNHTHAYTIRFPPTPTHTHLKKDLLLVMGKHT